MECPICYTKEDLVSIHSCSHPVCGPCLVRLVRHGLHHECSYCRSPLAENYTIGISRCDNSLAVLLSDNGNGILVRGNSVEKVSNITTPRRLKSLVGLCLATVCRLDGKTILYGGTMQTQSRFLDCFFKVPMSSHDSREGRVLRRRLTQSGVQVRTLSDTTFLLSRLMQTLVFPVMLIDVVVPPMIEEIDTEYTL